MKYNILGLILAILFASCNSKVDRSFVNAYMSDDLDSLSFDEIKVELAALQIQLSLIKGFSNWGESAEPKNYAEEQESVQEQFTLPADASEIDFSSGVSFTQTVKYPRSELNIKTEVKSETGQKITYFINQIYYKDGTVDTINYSISSRHDTKFKVIDSVSITVRQRMVTDFELVVLDAKKKEVSYKNGFVKIDKLDKNYVQYHMSDSISRYFITAQAQTKAGNMVGTQSYSSGSFPNDKEKAFLEKGLERLDKITTKIEEDKYSTKEELLKDIDKYLAIDMGDSDKYYRNEYYYGNIQELVLYMAKERETTNYTMTFPVVSYISDYNIVEDSKGLLGIISSDGNEIVKPKYKNLDQLNDYYYNITDYHSDVIFLLNKEKGSLDELPYKARSIKKLTDECVRYSHLGKEGILNKEGKQIVPNIYESIVATSAQPYVIIAYTEKGFDLYSADGSTKTYSGTGYLHTKDVDGWNITPFEGGSWALSYNNSGDPVAFISPDGRKTLNVSQYKKVNLFSEGLAAVSNKNQKFGFIRTDGSVAIPFIYDEAYHFSYGVSLVEKRTNDGWDSKGYIALINTKGEYLVPFEAYGSMSVNSNFGKRVYNINSRSYDHKGQLISE